MGLDGLDISGSYVRSHFEQSKPLVSFCNDGFADLMHTTNQVGSIHRLSSHVPPPLSQVRLPQHCHILSQINSFRRIPQLLYVEIQE